MRMQVVSVCWLLVQTVDTMSRCHCCWVQIYFSILLDSLKNCLDLDLQTSNLKTPWYLAFRTMVLRERELRRKTFRLGIVKCAESKSITLSPNTKRTIRGYICQHVLYTDTPVILQPTELTTMNMDLDIAPMLFY